MEKKLEQLLNSLIEKGWKPFGEGCHRSPYKRVGIHKNYNKERTYVLFYSNNHSHWKVLRQVVSKESGLWQFVCENGMYKKEALGLIFNDERAKNVFYKIDQFDEEGDVIQTGDMGGDEFIHISEPEYRLIESALRDESELEDFLLQNIKVGND